MKRYVLFTDEELDDMIHGCEIEHCVDGEVLYFMAEGHFAQLAGANDVDCQQYEENPAHYGERNTGRSYRRKMARQKFKKKKEIGVYVDHACWVDWDEVDGQWMPVGKYIKYPKDSEMRRYFKKYSNKKVRRAKYDDISTKGNNYRRQFDYWWTLY